MIKNIIPAAALFAASTALAGATTYVADGDSFYAFTSWYDGNVSKNTSIYSLKLNTSAIVGTGTSSSYTTTTIDTGDTYEVSSISLALYSYSNSVASTTAMVITDSSYNIIAISTGTTVSSGNYYGENSGKALDTFTFSDLYITSGTTYYAFAVTLDAAEVLEVGSTLTTTIYTGTVTTDNESTANVYSTFSVIGTTSDLTYAVSTDNAVDTASYGTLSACVQYVLTKVTAVPEPSAFGLLAGIGALALVAARRRRR